jgi:hypothetical protein
MIRNSLFQFATTDLIFRHADRSPFIADGNKSATSGSSPVRTKKLSQHSSRPLLDLFSGFAALLSRGFVLAKGSFSQRKARFAETKHLNTCQIHPKAQQYARAMLP